VLEKEKPHDAISKNADLGNDHCRFDRVRHQKLGPCIGQPLGWASTRHQIARTGYGCIPSRIFAVVPFAPNPSVAPEAAHIDARG